LNTSRANIGINTEAEKPIALIAATITTLENVPTRAFSNETPPYDRAGSAQPPSDLAPGALRVSSGNVVAKALTPRPSVFRIG